MRRCATKKFSSSPGSSCLSGVGRTLQFAFISIKRFTVTRSIDSIALKMKGFFPAETSAPCRINRWAILGSDPALLRQDFFFRVQDIRIGTSSKQDFDCAPLLAMDCNVEGCATGLVFHLNTRPLFNQVFHSMRLSPEPRLCQNMQCRVAVIFRLTIDVDTQPLNQNFNDIEVRKPTLTCD